MRAATTRRATEMALPALVAIAAAVTVTGARPAHAGRSPFGWVRASEVIPERSVELETWILEENGVGDDDENDTAPDETAIWWSTVVGITDRIEIALPIELRHVEVGSSGGLTVLYGYGAEARWRLVSPDPVEAGPFAPAVRLGVHRLVNARARTRSEAGVVLGVDIGARVHAAADIGVTWIVGGGESTFELAPAGGVSVVIFDQLRAGAEVYGEIALNGDEKDWLAAGPNLAWTHGRFWVAAALPIGIIDIKAAPRINWGVAF